MNLAIEHAQPVPLETGRDGIVRLRGTRVTLDTLVEAFLQGATAEEIVQQYPSLGLADVYSVLGYYLQHEAEITTYLGERATHREAIREENERRFDPQGVRDRLLNRRRK